MKKLISFLAVSISLNVYAQPECGKYLFYVNQNDLSSKTDILAFLDAISQSVVLQNINIISTQPSVLVTADFQPAAAENANKLLMNTIVKILKINGTSVQCDQAIPPAQF